MEAVILSDPEEQKGLVLTDEVPGHGGLVVMIGRQVGDKEVLRVFGPQDDLRNSGDRPIMMADLVSLWVAQVEMPGLPPWEPITKDGFELAERFLLIHSLS